MYNLKHYFFHSQMYDWLVHLYKHEFLYFSRVGLQDFILLRDSGNIQLLPSNSEFFLLYCVWKNHVNTHSRVHTWSPFICRILSLSLWPKSKRPKKLYRFSKKRNKNEEVCKKFVTNFKKRTKPLPWKTM